MNMIAGVRRWSAVAVILCCCGLSACRWKHVANYVASGGGRVPLIVNGRLFAVNDYKEVHGEAGPTESGNPDATAWLHYNATLPAMPEFSLAVGDTIYYFINRAPHEIWWRDASSGPHSTASNTPPTELVRFNVKTNQVRSPEIPVLFPKENGGVSGTARRFSWPKAVAVGQRIFVMGSSQFMYGNIYYRSQANGGRLITFRPNRRNDRWMEIYDINLGEWFHSNPLPDGVDLDSYISLTSRGNTIYLISHNKAWKGNVNGNTVDWVSLPDYPGGECPIPTPGYPLFAGGINSNETYGLTESNQWRKGPALPFHSGPRYLLTAGESVFFYGQGQPNKIFALVSD